MSSYLASLKTQFQYYKTIAEDTIHQLPEEKLFWQFNEESNSIAMIINHLSGNMLSRWTDFRTSDGEKSWRNRDTEFEVTMTSKKEVMAQWDKGWTCLFDGLNSIANNEIEDLIYIRNMGHTITEALNRQLAHYTYHIGQIAFIGKMIQNETWQSLSIPKGTSEQYNKEKFEKGKRTIHFTKDL
ncbi:MAG: hypothetical protein BM564_03465 [Bacteroidetes bacterium MedPE-SWsnd-G2]|nr:MAG: hypothetical protein BM564_03465 [Bacteroidetes bacterium MedPE-SWsnd-G2]